MKQNFFTKFEFDDAKKHAIQSLNYYSNGKKDIQKGDLKSLEAIAKAMLAIQNYKY
jgi:hypothetical protein